MSRLSTIAAIASTPVLPTLTCLTTKVFDTDNGPKNPFQSIISASVADMSWVLLCCYDPKRTHLCTTVLAAKAAWGRQAGPWA